MTAEQLHRLVTVKMMGLQKKLEHVLGVTIALPRIGFRLRGTSAGRVLPFHDVVDFNPILMRDNTQEFLDSTVPHEYAHVVDRTLLGYTPEFKHAQSWQNLMQLFDAPADIVHKYDVSKITTSTTWFCKCTTHQMSRGEIKKVAGGMTFTCTACKGPLFPIKA